MAQIICHVSLDIKVRVFNTSTPFIKGMKGRGFLSGSYPDGITSIDGVPTSARVRVFIRSPDKSISDGILVADIMSGVDGTWRVENLPIEYKYDVISSKAGFNDVIVTNITPAMV